MKDPNTLEELTDLEKKTFKEVTWWDWLARLFPLTILAIASVCHFFQWKTTLDIILEVSLVIFAIVCFTWWYWAIYKIATSIRFMRITQQKFLDVANELKKIKKDIKKDDSTG